MASLFFTKGGGSGHTFLREIMLLVFAAAFLVAATVMTVIAMSSRRWLIVESKQGAIPGLPTVAVSIGLTGGDMDIVNDFMKVSTPFSFRESEKYCPKDACHTLMLAGIMCIIILATGIACTVVSMLLASVTAMQLGQIFAERGPLGPYTNYGR